MPARGAYAKVIGLAGGISAAFIIGIIAYGEITRPSGGGFLEKPTIQWTVGNMLKPDMILKYRLSHIDNNYQDVMVTLNFIEKIDGGWRVHISIEDAAKKAPQEVMLSKYLIPVSAVPEEFKPQMQMIQGSILWIVDYAATPKYLAPDAVWGTVTQGVQTQELKISAVEKVSTPAGTFDSYVLSYSTMNKQNRIWIVEDMPLPVKGEVYSGRQTAVQLRTRILDCSYLIAL